MFHIALLLTAALLAGCAGSTTMPLSQDTVQITSRAAPICGSEGAEKVAVRQASVETIRRGFDRFVILDAAATSNVGVVGYTPVTAHTTGYATATGYGNFATAQGSSTTTYSGGFPIVAGKHKQGLIVKMFKDGDPAGANALSARTELGPRWKELAASESITCFD
jgi:hypothetical protein